MSKRKFYTTKKVRAGDLQVGDCLIKTTMRGETYWVMIESIVVGSDEKRVHFTNGESYAIENDIALIDIQVEDE